VLIPFVCPNAYPFEEDWVAALNDAISNVIADATVMPLDQMSAAQKAEVELAIVANPNPADLTQLPNLKWVHSVWAGVERLLADLQHSDIEIVRLVDPALADTMAEAVLAWTLYLHRQMPLYRQQQERQQWLEHDYTPASQKRVSLLGLGELGQASVKRLALAGFQVAGWSQSRKAFSGVTCYAGDELPDMLENTDILVILLPLTRSTRLLVDQGLLKALPKGASLINFARGPIIDETALKNALDAKTVDHAVLDVFDQEPLPKEAWQWTHPSVTVLPHISAPTSRNSAAKIVADNIARYRATGVLPPIVDKQRGY
jgi:glyoxylate/hydroxypyruvate reductase A